MTLFCSHTCAGGCDGGQPKQKNGTDDLSIIHHLIFHTKFIHNGLHHAVSINIPGTQSSYK
jgi:hypothetical protein